MHDNQLAGTTSANSVQSNIVRQATVISDMLWYYFCDDSILHGEEADLHSSRMRRNEMRRAKSYRTSQRRSFAVLQATDGSECGTHAVVAASRIYRTSS